MTISFAVVANVFSNTLIFLLQKCKKLLQCKRYSDFFQQKKKKKKKISMYLPYFKIEMLRSR